MILHGWRISGLPGSQTATPTETDVTPTIGASQLPQHSLYLTGGGTTYFPEIPFIGVQLPTRVEIVLKSRVTIRWTGVGVTPSTVKLKLDGGASASYRLGPGSIVADGGMITFNTILEQGTELVGGPPATPLPYGNTYSGAIRYREFTLTNGEVSIYHVAQASAGGTGQWNASTSYIVSPSDWAVRLYSDRGLTYRRLEQNQVVKRISNTFEDDGVTSRGGDGGSYTDSCFDDMAESPKLYFHSLITAIWFGPYSPEQYMTILSDYELEPVGLDQMLTGVDEEDENFRGRLSYLTSAYMNDPVNDIEENGFLTTTVHREAERVRSLGTYLGILSDIRDSQDFQEFSWSSYMPAPELDCTQINATTSPLNLTLTKVSTTQTSAGYVSGVQGTVSFPVKMIKLEFGGSFQVTSHLDHTISNGVGVGISVPPNTTFLPWRVPVGSVEKFLYAHYDRHGYVQDSVQFSLHSFAEVPAYGFYGPNEPWECPR